jgi:polygalacturonase
MTQLVNVLGFMLSAAALVSAVPTPTAAPEFNPALLAKRASCTFTAASAASASKKNCATIVLDNIAVPSGVTLDLTSLTSGTHVIFEGETTWGYEEWSGPLLSISGQNIVVTGNSGHKLNGNGAKWWDGQGSNGGKTKPKFFYAHGLTGTSSITGLNILNTPVQAVSVNGASGLTIASMTIDNSAGDSGALGHNTDAFDVGSSTDVTISGAVVKNQDDCLAINSGTVSSVGHLPREYLANNI